MTAHVCPYQAIRTRAHGRKDPWEAAVCGRRHQTPGAQAYPGHEERLAYLEGTGHGEGVAHE